MSRLKTTFAVLKEKQKKGLIPFITAGDPQPGVTVKLMHALVAAGANILELGVPFSDPMADGPVIQRASERALIHHVSLRDVIKMVAEFRQIDASTPVILMGYLNPVEIMGYASFADHAAAAGVDGLLTVDMPPEEAEDLVAELKRVGIDPIFLLAPTTAEDRIKKVTRMASGFIYYVSVKGITGSAQLDVKSVESKLATIREHSNLPVGVGFGIKDGESAAMIGALADAVVVGSALVSRLEVVSRDEEKLVNTASTFISELRAALDKC